MLFDLLALRSETLAANNPAAGVDLSATFPDEDFNYIVTSIHVELVTDANVANRYLNFELVDRSGKTIWNTACGTAQTASLTWEYNLSLCHSAGDDNFSQGSTILNSGFPVVLCKGGDTINVTITNIQATDQIQNILIRYCWQRLNG